MVLTPTAWLRPVAILIAFLVLPSAGLLPSAAPRSTGPLATFTSDWGNFPAGTINHPLPSSTQLTLTVTLAARDPVGLAAFARAVTDPADPNYHRFLSEAGFEARFSPPPDSVARIESYFGGYGAHSFDATVDRTAVTLSLPAGGASAALGTTFVSGASGEGRSLYAAASAPHLPPQVARLVTGISGLSDQAATNFRPSAPLGPGGSFPIHSGTGQFVNDSRSGTSWYYGSDYAQAYRVDGLFPPSGTRNATYAHGEAVATILMSGYNDSFHVNLPPFDPAVVRQYYNDTFPTAWPHPTIVGVPVPIGNVVPPPAGPYGNLRDSSLNELENSLDLEMAGSMAPGAMVANFYFGASLYMGPSGSPSNAAAADYFALCLSAALSHNYSNHRLDAVTNSFGLPDLNDTLWNAELLHAATIGVTVLASSGDQGNAPEGLTNRFQGQWPSWPATAAFDTFGTVAVGGASLNLGGRAVGDYQGHGRPLPIGYDSNLSGAVDQETWYDTLAGPGNFTGSEGGVTALYAEPAWQFHSAAQPSISNSTGIQGLGQLGRSEPDVALAANATIAYVRANQTSIFFEVLEGTSISSPLLAGMIAEWSAVAGHPFGYLAPEFYHIASYYAAHPGPGDPFLDVVQGANFVFSAQPGWDAVTGWGGLNASAFLSADQNRNVSGFQYTGPTPGVPPQKKATVPQSANPLWFVVGGVVVAMVVVLVLYLGRSKPGPRPLFQVPAGAFNLPGPYPGPPPGGPFGIPPPPGSNLPPPPATFACPYCGSTRPAEPVRCPGCGAL